MITSLDGEKDFSNHLYWGLKTADESSNLLLYEPTRSKNALHLQIPKITNEIHDKTFTCVFKYNNLTLKSDLHVFVT